MLWSLCLLWAAGALAAPLGRARPKLLLISFDGFRWDYDRDVDTPNLDQMARDGVKAAYVTPPYITITSPAHFTLLTGECPAGARRFGPGPVQEPRGPPQLTLMGVSPRRPLRGEPRRHPQHVVQHHHGPEEAVLPDAPRGGVVGQRDAAHLDHSAEAGGCTRSTPPPPTPPSPPRRFSRVTVVTSFVPRLREAGAADHVSPLATVRAAPSWGGRFLRRDL